MKTEVNRFNPPKGCYIVTGGEVQPGDLLWDAASGWEPAHHSEIERPAGAFNAVARPYSNTKAIHRPSNWQ